MEILASGLVACGVVSVSHAIKYFCRSYLKRQGKN